MRGLLSNERYEELKKLVVEMFEEAEVNSLPIDCFYIAKKLKYVLRPYSQLDLEAYLDAMDISVEGYSQVEKNPVTGMYEYVSKCMAAGTKRVRPKSAAVLADRFRSYAL